MTRIQVQEAKAKLSEMLDRAEHGEEPLQMASVGAARSIRGFQRSNESFVH